jgi:hypothetical protein
MLLALPRHPRKTTAREIRDRLAAQQFETTTRTVQRDLLELARVFPIAYDGRSKPYGWSWAKDAAGLQLPSLSVAEALTMQMVERYLRGLLPASTLQVSLIAVKEPGMIGVMEPVSGAGNGHPGRG